MIALLPGPTVRTVMSMALFSMSIKTGTCVGLLLYKGATIATFDRTFGDTDILE